MWGIIGVIIGLVLYRLIMVPIERKRYRDECIRKGGYRPE